MISEKEKAGLAPTASGRPPATGPGRGIGISADGRQILVKPITVVAILCRMHDVGPGRRPAVKAKLKYMRRHDFPVPGALKGRIVFGMEELVRLVAAFEFMNGGMSVQRAVRLVRTDWDLIREGFLKAWWLRHGPAGGPVTTALAIEPHALMDVFDRDDMWDVPLFETLGLVGVDRITGLATAETRRQLLLIDIGHAAERLVAAVVAEQLATRTEVERAMLLACGDLFGTHDHVAWPSTSG